MTSTDSQARRCLNVALIGAGDVAQLHMAGLAKLESVRYYGVASQTLDEARRAAARFQFDSFTDDYRTLLADPEVDVVHVLTPNATHFDIVSEVLKAGKHVVAEKPLGLSVDEASTLQQLADQSGQVCAVNYHYRYFSQVQSARKCIADGQPGELRLLQGSFLQDWLSRETDFNWRLGEKGGGVVTDIGCHWFDLVEYVTGAKVLRVYARLQTAVPVRRNGDSTVAVAQPDCGTILFDLEGGAFGTVTVSQVSPGRKNFLGVEITGSEQSLAWNVEEANDLWVGARDGNNRLLRRPGDYMQVWGGGVAALLAQAYGAIRGDSDAGEDYPRFADAVRSHQLTRAILESAAAGEWVDIPAAD